MLYSFPVSTFAPMRASAGRPTMDIYCQEILLEVDTGKTFGRDCKQQEGTLLQVAHSSASEFDLLGHDLQASLLV